MKKLLFVVSLMLVTTVCYGQELLTNPGFETGDFTGWTTCGAPGGFGSDQFTPVPHTGAQAPQECGCCGQHDAGGAIQTQTAAAPATVGGWARTCSYGGTSNTDIGYGGGCMAPGTVIGAPLSDCVWAQFTTTLAAGSITVGYVIPSTGWGATCNAADDMTIFQTAVDGWMFY